MGIKFKDSHIVKTSCLDQQKFNEYHILSAFFKDNKGQKEKNYRRIKLHPNLLKNKFHNQSYKNGCLASS